MNENKKLSERHLGRWKFIDKSFRTFSENTKNAEMAVGQQIMKEREKEREKNRHILNLGHWIPLGDRKISFFFSLINFYW